MYTELINKCREIVKCDTARISKPGDRMFLIIGFNRNTKDDPGQFIKNGEPYDFDYVQETVIASGDTEAELIVNVKEYQRLCGITWEQYFKELASSTQKEQSIIANVSNCYADDCLIQSSCSSFKTERCNKECKLYA